MSYFYQVLSQRVDGWRAATYPCDGFPAICEILEFATEDGEAEQLRFLRRAQFRALETYWYLRLVLETPRIPDLYAKLFSKPKDRREANDAGPTGQVQRLLGGLPWDSGAGSGRQEASGNHEGDHQWRDRCSPLASFARPVSRCTGDCLNRQERS